MKKNKNAGRLLMFAAVLVFGLMYLAEGRTGREEAPEKILVERQTETENSSEAFSRTFEETPEKFSESPEESTTAEPERQLPEDDRININTANRETLITLPQIGEARADAIIRWRETHGAFTGIEDIMLVKGIGEGIFERIRTRIRV